MNFRNGIIGALVVLGIFSAALAAKSSKPISWVDLVEELAQKCEMETGVCDSPYSAELYEGTKLAEFSQIERAKEEAENLSQTWWDTVYEGDIQPDGPVVVDSFVEIKAGRKTVAYYMTYSQRAHLTADEECEFDGEHWQNCTPGNVIEKCFISPDWSEFHIREEDSADFFD